MASNPSDIVHLNWLESSNLDDFRGKRVLDLGCGSGYICQQAMKSGAVAAVGIDLIDPGASSEESWKFCKADLDSSNWEEDFSDAFDLILAFDIIEHLDSPYRFLQSCYRILSKSGRLVVTTPNSLSWERFYKPDNWSGVQDPQHKTLFTKYTLDFMVRKIGLVPTTLSAPVRSLGFLKSLQPQIGGQILCVATRG